MGKLQTKAAECDYKEYNTTITEQFIKGLGDTSMISEILREVSALENTDDTASMLWDQRVEIQRMQKEALDSIKKAKDFDSVRCSTQEHANVAHRKQK